MTNHSFHIIPPYKTQRLLKEPLRILLSNIMPRPATVSTTYVPSPCISANPTVSARLPTKPHRWHLTPPPPRGPLPILLRIRGKSPIHLARAAHRFGLPVRAGIVLQAGRPDGPRVDHHQRVEEVPQVGRRPRGPPPAPRAGRARCGR